MARDRSVWHTLGRLLSSLGRLSADGDDDDESFIMLILVSFKYLFFSKKGFRMEPCAVRGTIIAMAYFYRNRQIYTYK